MVHALRASDNQRRLTKLCQEVREGSAMTSLKTAAE